MPAISTLAETLRRRVGADVPTAPVETENFVQVAGRKIFYQEAGKRENPSVLFLHGAGAPPEHLPAVINEVASRGFFVVAPEHPGMGRSEHLPTYRPNFFQRYAIAYYDFLLQRGVTEPIIIAQSFGGGPAGALAGLRHEHLAAVGRDTDRATMDEYRPRALVLVDSLMAEPLSQRSFRGPAGWLLENLEPALRKSPKNLRRLITSPLSGTPASSYRNDVGGDAEFARELGTLFRASTRGAPMVEVDLAEFIIGGKKEEARGIFTIKRQLSDLERRLGEEEARATGIAERLMRIEEDLPKADDARILTEGKLKQAENDLHEMLSARDQASSELERFEKALLKHLEGLK